MARSTMRSLWRWWWPSRGNADNFWAAVHNSHSWLGKSGCPNSSSSIVHTDSVNTLYHGSPLTWSLHDRDAEKTTGFAAICDTWIWYQTTKSLAKYCRQVVNIQVTVTSCISFANGCNIFNFHPSSILEKPHEISRPRLRQLVPNSRIDRLISASTKESVLSGLVDQGTEVPNLSNGLWTRICSLLGTHLLSDMYERGKYHIKTIRDSKMDSRDIHDVPSHSEFWRCLRFVP